MRTLTNLGLIVLAVVTSYTTPDFLMYIGIDAPSRCAAFGTGVDLFSYVIGMLPVGLAVLAVTANERWGTEQYRELWIVFTVGVCFYMIVTRMLPVFVSWSSEPDGWDGWSGLVLLWLLLHFLFIAISIIAAIVAMYKNIRKTVRKM